MEKKKGINKKLLLFLPIVIIILGLILGGILLYQKVHGINSKLKIKLNGKNIIKIEVGQEYKESGSIAFYEQKDLSKFIKVKGKVNTNKLGTYKINYIIKYKKLTKTIL